MIEQLHRAALAAVVAGLVMLPAGCASAVAAPPATPLVTTTAAAPTTTAVAAPAPTPSTRSSKTSTPPAAKPGLSSDNTSGCAARAMASGTFDPACDEYQGYLDPGTAGGRAPTSGEIQHQDLCRSGQIPRTEC